MAALCLLGTAHAGVFKCPGPDGRVILTDAPCPDGQAVKIRQGNTVAAERPPAGNPFDQFDQAEPARAQVIGGDEPQPAAQPTQKQPRHQRSSGPTILTNCDAAGCWDTGGQRYNRAAGGTFFRQDGKACRMVANQLRCD